MNKVQTILGAGGVFANELETALKTYTENVRLVSGSNRSHGENTNQIKANLLNAEHVANAVKGSEIVYLTASLKHRTKLWQKEWPIIMQNTLAACRKHNAKLVFFDNVYPYGKVKGWMTEATPYRPFSEKGKIRETVANMLMDAVETGQIQALIARSADFYGPRALGSFTHALIFNKLAKNQKPYWFLSDEFKHSFTYIPDAGKATAQLGNTPQAFDQIWHLPTDQKVLTGQEFIAMAAETFDRDEDHYGVYKKWMLSIVGLYNKAVKENLEMLYQFDDDYLFDSSKYEKAFGIKATPYKLGMINIYKSLKSK